MFASTFDNWAKNIMYTENYPRPVPEFNPKYPPVSVDRTDQGYMLILHVPGFNAKDVNIKVENRIITISGTPQVELNKPLQEGFPIEPFTKKFKLLPNTTIYSVARLNSGLLKVEIKIKPGIQANAVMRVIGD